MQVEANRCTLLGHTDGHTDEPSYSPLARAHRPIQHGEAYAPCQSSEAQIQVSAAQLPGSK